MTRVLQNFGPVVDISKLRNVELCVNECHRFYERV